jgi:uncharacterized protein (UPF0276 family)
MWQTRASPAVGAAYCGYIPAFLRDEPQALDYVEVPFELLRHDPSVYSLAKEIPLVLHCASLSVASPGLCPAETLSQIQHSASAISSPWIGEHLAFITADREEAGGEADAYAPGEPYNIGYTVAPPMNADTSARVAKHLRYYAGHLAAPLLIENSPLYFRIPSSTMSQAEFVTDVLDRSPAGLLLDLAHFLISSETMGFDAESELERFPLERAVEIHVSGVDRQPDGVWDNHAARAPQAVYRLLEQALRRARPRAITLEYNWSVRFSQSMLLEEIAKVREMVDVCCAVDQHADA